MLGLAAVLAAVALLPAASAQEGWQADAERARRGIDNAERAGRLSAESAARFRGILNRSFATFVRLPGRRSEALRGVLRDVAAQSRGYNEPRALTLFSMLEENARYLGSHEFPSRERDIEGADGVLYRARVGSGYQFHPLGNFIKLFALLGQKRYADASELAYALHARGVLRPNNTLAWEYHFRWAGGRPPWTSGMAQALAAQSLARAAEELGEPAFQLAADRAYRSVPAGLLRTVDGRPWVKLYSFSSLAVLNAQLQTALSLADYATRVESQEAAALAQRLMQASAELLPRFDTGAWSLYSLDGRESPLEYHTYVVDLLTLLGRRTQDQFWFAEAQRFDGYLREPPALQIGPAAPPAYPVPRDGFRDRAEIRFGLSKISRVTVTAGGRRATALVSRGRGTVELDLGRLRPGRYPVHARAVDLAGNVAELDLAPLVVERDREAPRLTARVVRTRLVWRARDKATPWVRLTLVLEGDDFHTRRVVRLGRRPLKGSLRLRLPAGIWQTTLLATDSSGNRAQRRLGLLAGRGH